MAKRKFAAVGTALVLAFVGHTSQAESSPILVDGCAELARVVYAEVSSAALYGPGKSGPWILDTGQGDVSICTHAAQTVSRAFTSAMRSAGFTVNWDRPRGGAGDFCESGFLSQCYPSQYPIGTSIHGSNSVFVNKSWSVVSHSVMRQMHNPFSSNEVRFRDNDLKLRLGLSLRTARSTEKY